MKRPATTTSESGEEENYFIPLSDLMAGVVVIFVLVLSVSLLHNQLTGQRIDEAIRESGAARTLALNHAEEASTARRMAQQAYQAQKSAEERSAIRGEKIDALAKVLQRQNEALTSKLSQIAENLAAQGVRVQVDAEHRVLRLPDDLLFQSGSDVLKANGVEALKVLAAELAAVLEASSSGGSEFQLEAVFVEGHTDNVQIRSGRFVDNWDLSTARATGTYRALIREMPALETFRNQADHHLLGVSGYGENRPAASNDTEESRAQNRRIDIRFLIAPPSERDLKALEEVVEAQFTQ